MQKIWKENYLIKSNKDINLKNEEIDLHNSIEYLANKNLIGSNLDDYFYSLKGNNTYQFMNGYYVVDQFLLINIFFIIGGTVERYKTI